MTEKNIIFFAFARKNKHLLPDARKFSLAITRKNGHTLRWFLLSTASPADATVQDEISGGLSEGFERVRDIGKRSILFFGVGCAAVLRQGIFT